MGLSAEDVLHQIPLRNAHADLLPQAQRKLDLPPLALPETTPAKQHLEAWIEECSQISQAIKQRKDRGKRFDTWYAENCLSKQPPGITDCAVLSPSRRQVKENSV
ncbi:hypothetical protein ACU8KH_00512 [Lachancea thermotolerans]|uniref:KLTH0B01342p n=1 Tax=Lachancea thermotolerans (strain ATCC 56472 / CBS 6340 / NRRL Y-8284) TaxID=559295 RepID=C5DCA0_LACTC|nr:KLTH0B01342p [Lachancea thermotolerans CBS 6340]CAR21411.1 KLTH0B01342p [Lachancea thermotolerans CBS 6340]